MKGSGKDGVGCMGAERAQRGAGHGRNRAFALLGGGGVGGRTPSRQEDEGADTGREPECWLAGCGQSRQLLAGAGHEMFL